MLWTKPIGSADSGHATALNTTGTPNAATRGRHCRLSNGSSSNTIRTGLSTNVRPIATPASHWPRLVPRSNQVKNSTSASSTQPLTLVNTRVLVTDSVQNIASSSAGSATELSRNPKSRTSTHAATMIATVLMAMNQLRDANSGRKPNGASSSVPPGGYR